MTLGAGEGGGKKGWGKGLSLNEKEERGTDGKKTNEGINGILSLFL